MGGVNPWSETVSILTGCRLLDFGSHLDWSGSDSAPVGEAEAGSAGEQPAKE